MCSANIAKLLVETTAPSRCKFGAKVLMGSHPKSSRGEGVEEELSTQLERPDFSACKIRWKHIAQCLNLASHFASTKTLIFNKGFACTNLHWNLYIVCIVIHYVLHCIIPNAEHVQHLKFGHMQTFDFILNFAVSIYHHATRGI